MLILLHVSFHQLLLQLSDRTYGVPNGKIQPHCYERKEWKILSRLKHNPGNTKALRNPDFVNQHQSMLCKVHHKSGSSRGNNTALCFETFHKHKDNLKRPLIQFHLLGLFQQLRAFGTEVHLLKKTSVSV